MDFTSISEAARFGMTYERTRVEAASQNLALANVAFSSAEEAQQAADKITKSLFASLVGTQQNASTQAQAKVKVVHSPAHPLANAEGNIFYADVDPVKEMATLVSAIRAYEANVRAYNTNSDMNKAALSIGGNR